MATIFNGHTAPKKKQEEPDWLAGTTKNTPENNDWLADTTVNNGGPDAENVSDEEITPYSLRARVGALHKPEDRLSAIRSVYPDAQPTDAEGSNFIFTDPKTGKTHYYNVEGWTPSMGDFASILPEAAEVTGGIVGGAGGAVGGGALGTAVAPGPGTTAGAVGGAMLGASVGGAGAKDLTERGIRWLSGDEDTRTTDEWLADKAKDAAYNAAGEGVGRALGYGFKAGRQFIREGLTGAKPGEMTDAMREAARARQATFKEAGIDATPGMITQLPGVMEKEAAIVASKPKSILAVTTKNADDGIAAQREALITELMPVEKTKAEVGKGLLDATTTSREAANKRVVGLYDDASKMATNVRTSNKTVAEVLAAQQAEMKALGATDKINKTPMYKESIKYLTAAKKDFADAGFDQARAIRKTIGDIAFDKSSDPTTRALFKQTYEAMTKDIAAATKAQGEDVFQAWRAADDANSALVKKGGVDDVLEAAQKDGNPTGVYKFFLTQAKNNPENLGAIRTQILKDGGEPAWREFAGRVTQDLGVSTSKETGEKVFNPSKFLSDVKAMPKETRQVVMTPEHLEKLEKLTKLVEARQPSLLAAKASNGVVRQADLGNRMLQSVMKKGTAKIIGGVAGSMLDGGLSIVGTGLGVAAGAGVDIAKGAWQRRLLENPKIVDWMLAVPKAQMKPNFKTEMASQIKHLRALGRAAGQETGDAIERWLWESGYNDEQND